jgi:hypothetical protein
MAEEPLPAAGVFGKEEAGLFYVAVDLPETA